MIDLCKKCDAWDDTHERLRHLPELAEMGILHPGICRKPAPSGIRVANVLVGVQLITDADDSCGQFRIKE